MTHFCCHEDARCLEKGIQCEDCDSNGYPVTSRRRLKRQSDGTVRDIEDQQEFKVKRTKTGDRLVPKFDGRVEWKGYKGFAAMLLILSCLGAECEYVLWDSERNEEMDVEEWKRRRYGTYSFPPVRHRVCKQTVTSTCISSLQQGTSVGCTCNSNKSKHWRYRRSEIVKIGKECGFEVLTMEDVWMKECNGFSYHPTLRCSECKEEVTTTSVGSLHDGHKVGCTCNSNHANHWRNRRSEIVTIGKEYGFEVVATEEMWVEECNGKCYCPTLRCNECKEEVTTTSVESLHGGHNVGCTCNSSHAKHWRNRRSEIVTIGKERGFEVVTTEEMWMEKCSGVYYCPTLRCDECKREVTSTSVGSLHGGHGIGCWCKTKTERKLGEWLRTRFPDATVTAQYHGPGLTRFDFHITFSDDFEVLVELDGPQHFWAAAKYYTIEGCERDVQKEIWAATKGLCVVRVLQEDVWEDRYDWQGFLLDRFQIARSCDPPIPLTPDAPEYRSKESAYVRLGNRKVVA